MPDIVAVGRLIEDVAATEIMPLFEKLEKSQINEKKPGDLVTAADIAAEKRLTPELMALMPGSIVVGEEAASADPSILERLAGEDAVWVVDPVDGTANFAAGLPLFAVMVAFVRGGRTLAGWIYDPIKRQMTSVERGAGAWCEGRRLNVATPTGPESMSGSFGVKYGNRQLVRRIAGRSNLVGSVFSFRCAGQEYLALANGRTHFALYHRLYPWDHAPGQLMHEEAGGFSARLDRSPYSPRVLDGGLLLTPDEGSWTALHDVLIGNEKIEGGV